MRNSHGDRFRAYLELSKIKIMIPVSLTCFTGYFIFSPRISFEIIAVSLGVLFLAISSSVLNQIQEADIDSKMNRTRSRPIPSGRIKVKNALVFFLMTFSAGSILIYTEGAPGAILIALFTVLWYNGAYTLAKRVTAFAVVPGALTGALPPAIGWVAAGGGIFDKAIIFIMFLFFTGQIPHFWLLILKYGEEYSEAGMPSLTDILQKSQIKRLTYTWVVTSVIAALFLCYFEIIQSLIIVAILLAGSALLIWQFSDLIRSSLSEINYRKYSILLYAYYLLILILLITDRLILL